MPSSLDALVGRQSLSKATNVVYGEKGGGVGGGVLSCMER